MIHGDADPLVNVLVMKNMVPVAVKQKRERDNNGTDLYSSFYFIFRASSYLKVPLSTS